MASSSKCLSDFLSRIGAAKPGEAGSGEEEEEPDWLLGSDDEDANDGGERDEGTQDSEPDPFGYLTTPINLTGKPDDGETDEAPDTTTPKQKADREAGSTPAETPGSTGKGTKKNKGSKAAASAAVSGTIPLKNPDKIIFNRLLLEIPYMGDDSVDLSGDVGAVGRILMHAPDEDLAEPALFIPGANGPNQPDSGPSKRAPDAAGPSENAVKASVDDKRLLPDSEAAKDLAGPSADADGSMHDGAGPSEAVATGGRDSNGGKPNGQLASGSRRGSKARRSCSGVDGESGKQKEASEKLLEDDDIEEVSEEYVKSEDESEGGSEGGPVGKKRKRKAAKRSGKDGSDGSLDEGTQEVEAVFNEFVQMEKKTFMSEYEEGDAEEADYNLGGHGVDEDLPKDSQKAKAGKSKKPVIASSGRVANRTTKSKAKKGGKKGTGAKRK